MAFAVSTSPFPLAKREISSEGMYCVVTMVGFSLMFHVGREEEDNREHTHEELEYLEEHPECLEEAPEYPF